MSSITDEIDGPSGDNLRFTVEMMSTEPPSGNNELEARPDPIPEPFNPDLFKHKLRSQEEDIRMAEATTKTQETSDSENRTSAAYLEKVRSNLKKVKALEREAATIINTLFSLTVGDWESLLNIQKSNHYGPNLKPVSLTVPGMDNSQNEQYTSQVKQLVLMDLGRYTNSREIFLADKDVKIPILPGATSTNINRQTEVGTYYNGLLISQWTTEFRPSSLVKRFGHSGLITLVPWKVGGKKVYAFSAGKYVYHWGTCAGDGEIISVPFPSGDIRPETDALSDADWIMIKSRITRKSAYKSWKNVGDSLVGLSKMIRTTIDPNYIAKIFETMHFVSFPPEQEHTITESAPSEDSAEGD